MRHSVKLIGASALALTFAYGGHGAMNAAQGVPAVPRASVAFAPAARNDAAFVIGACLDKDKLWGVLDVFLDKLAAASGPQGEEIRGLKAQLAEYKANPFKDVSKNNEFLKESGILDADYRWAVLSMDEMPDFSANSSIPGGLALAVAGNINLEKFMAVAQRKLAEKEEDAAEFKEETVEGEKSWHLVPLNEKSAQEMKKSKVDPYVTWLDNQLVVAATSRGALAKQIRLFRKGEGNVVSLRDLASPDTVAGLFIVGFGEIMRQNVAQEQLEGLNAIPNGQQIFYGLKTMSVDLKSASGEDVRLALRFGAASEVDADVLRTFMKTGLMVFRAQMAQSPEQQAGALPKLLEGVKVGGADGVLEISLDTNVTDLADVVSKFMAEKSTPDNAPRGAGSEGKPRRRRRAKTVRDGDATK